MCPPRRQEIDYGTSFDVCYWILWLRVYVRQLTYHVPIQIDVSFIHLRNAFLSHTQSMHLFA